ncbi:Extracellular matrix binding protein [Staphylococcus aureus]|uniref:Extracellular matrix binding protein n=1 Tax=Staphylococcus aureus TaxID=1280 RepID=A0A2X2K6H1_STAAU|nr:Extracellular matrix binding protein [Staphylococcus aureus]
MTHLSDAQKQSITVQIDNATQVTGVQSGERQRDKS